MEKLYPLMANKLLEEEVAVQDGGGVEDDPGGGGLGEGVGDGRPEERCRWSPCQQQD